MKKFCPNCGAPLDPNDKFCSHCGYVIANNQSNAGAPTQQPQQTQQVNQQPAQPITRSAKSRNKKWIGVVIGAVILCLLAIGVGVLFVHHQNEQQVAATVDKMSKRKLAGLTIEYAHLHYKDNSAWNDVYNDAQNGNVTVKRYKQYNINNSTVTAKGNNYVYVINKKAIFTTDNDKKNSQSDITISDGKRQLGVVKATDAYKDVQKHNAISNMNKINKVASININNRQLGILALKVYKPILLDAVLKASKDPDIPYNYEPNGKDGFTRVTSGGSSGSDLDYKREGSKLIIRYIDVDYAVAHGSDAADAPTRTKSFNLQDVINKYYSTSSQRSEVDSMAQKLRTESGADQ